MPTHVEEGYYDWDKSVDRNGSLIEAEIPYIVFEAGDEDAALAAALERAPKKLNGMAFDHAEIDSRINSNTYKVRAVYAKDGDTATTEDEDDSTPESTYAFDTSGGTMHRNQSLGTSVYPPSAPSFGGAIGVDNDGSIAGVDVTMPVFNFTETHTLAASRVTTAYKKKVAALTGTVNSSSFRGFDAGEVLFIGASGSRNGNKSSDPWEVTFRFAVSPNKTGLSVGGIKSIQKKGWDYLWVRYADSVSGTSLIKSPVAAYVEKVYESADFSNLGLGN